MLEKGWLGSGNIGRNTTIIRSNYMLPGNNPFYELSMKLWEGLEQDFNFNAMVSQRGVLNLCHTDAQRDAFAGAATPCASTASMPSCSTATRCARCIRSSTIDNARFPIKGGLLQRRGGTVRHDAVAWGYARGADSRGVDIIQNCEVTGIKHRERQGRGRRDQRAASSAARSSAWRRRAIHRKSRPWRACKLPIESHVLQAFVSEGLKPYIDGVVTFGAGHFYVSQSDKGGLVFGGDIDGYNSYARRGNLPMVEHVIEAGVAMIPGLSRVRVLRSWGGIMDMSMDGSPIIDKTAVSTASISMPAGAMAASRQRRPRAGASPTRSPRDEPHTLNAAYRLDRFRRGYMLDEKGQGATPNLH